MNVLSFCHTPQKRRHFFEHSLTPHFPSSSKTTSFTAQQGKKGKGVFFLTTICFSSPMSPAKRRASFTPLPYPPPRGNRARRRKTESLSLLSGKEGGVLLFLKGTGHLPPVSALPPHGALFPWRRNAFPSSPKEAGAAGFRMDGRIFSAIYRKFSLFRHL